MILDPIILDEGKINLILIADTLTICRDNLEIPFVRIWVCEGHAPSGCRASSQSRQYIVPEIHENDGKLHELGFRLLSLSQYSPDLPSSNCFLHSAHGRRKEIAKTEACFKTNKY